MEETGNFVAKLNEYAHSAHVLVNYEDVCSDGPAHIKTFYTEQYDPFLTLTDPSNPWISDDTTVWELEASFTVRAVVNGKPYPDGVGKTKKEARQCAARHALLGLEKEQREPENTVLFVCSTGQSGRGSERGRTGDRVGRITRVGRFAAECVRWLATWVPRTLDENFRWEELEEQLIQEVEEARIAFMSVLQARDSWPNPFPRLIVDRTTSRGSAALQAGALGPNPFPRLIVDRTTSRGSAALHLQAGALGPNPFPRLIVDRTTSRGEKMGNMSSSSPVPKRNILADNVNYIGILNHYCQKTKRYHDCILVERRGPAHNPEFVYKVILDKKEYPEGVGKNAMEAKQQAAKMAWSAFQEQSDWDSQISCKSTLSEEGASSSPSMPSSSRGSLDSSSSSFVMITASDSTLSDGSSPKNSDVKPKIRLAANFQMAPTWSKGDDSDFSRETKVAISATQRTSSQPAVSRFESEYDSIERLGKGGFGQVYKARRQLEGKFFAVKKVRSNKKALREVGALADLQHPHIVRYYTSWIDDFDYQCDTSDSISLSGSDTTAGKFLYIQMELCNKTLEVWMDERNTLRRDPRRREESLVIALQIVTGVEYIHSRRLIHRDLKLRPGFTQYLLTVNTLDARPEISLVNSPSLERQTPVNIMFGSDGGVKIGDFGLVTADDSDNDQNRTERTRKTGTTSYMAPEQMSQSNYDRKVDIFALGLTYFELLWKRSTKSEKAAIWSDVRSQTFPEQFSLKFPPEARTIQWMLSEKPEERPDAKTLRTELEAFFSPSLHREQNLHHGNNTV